MIGQPILIGNQFATEFKYRSIVGRGATILPWETPVWNSPKYLEQNCLLVYIEGASSHKWYIRKEDAIGVTLDNASQVGLLREGL